ncbi:MAG TPA: hydrolase [Bacteroidota bacterium]|nr:hydrolase [Bacteroidota bacterium]
MSLFDRSKTALVVIDLQKGIAQIPTQPYPSNAVIANASRLAKAFRKNHIPVILVRVTPSPDGKDALQPIADNSMQGGPRPPEWAEIVPEMGPESGDIVITKRQWGAFYGTELEMQLRRRKIDTIVLCGISTNAGVESTARFAYEYGFQQIFVEDASAARSKEEHEYPMRTILPRLGRVRKTEDVLAELG